MKNNFAALTYRLYSDGRCDESATCSSSSVLASSSSSSSSFSFSAS